MKKTLKRIITENPIFVLMLGLCSSLAVTTTVERAYLMGLSVLIVLLCSNIIICLIKKLVPNNVKVPVYILIIGTFVTILEMLLGYYAKPLYDILGIYLPLIVVNCIVLGRAISVASKENLKTSILDAISCGVGYTFALVIIAFFRELIGSGTITLMDSISTITGYRAIYRIYQPNTIFPFSIFGMEAGAFLCLGILMAIFNFIKNRGKKNESH